MMDWQSTLLTIVFSTLGTVLTGGVALLFAVLRKKWGLEVTEKQQALVQDAVRQGVSYAEEQARKRVLHGSGGATSGDEKLHMAAGYVAAKIDELKLPAVAPAKLEPMIEAKVQSERPAASPEVPR